jgi:hypothetical protein
MSEAYAEAKRAEWRALVQFVFECPESQLEEQVRQLAKDTSSDARTLKRKCDAIRYLRDTHNFLGQQDISAYGQSATLRDYKLAFRNGHYEKQRVLSWRVSKSLADAIQTDGSLSPDSEEPLVSRLIRVIGIQTSEELWEFWNSVFADLSDEDLKHLAGIERERKKRCR